jgi:hypothetical protein
MNSSLLSMAHRLIPSQDYQSYKFIPINFAKSTGMSLPVIFNVTLSVLSNAEVCCEVNTCASRKSAENILFLL